MDPAPKTSSHTTCRHRRRWRRQSGALFYFLFCSFPLVTLIGVVGQPHRLANPSDGRRSAHPTHEIQLQRTLSSLRKIQCSSASNPSADTIRTIGLKVNTLNLIPKLSFCAPK